jgi:excisionase family DNA binding protein
MGEGRSGPVGFDRALTIREAAQVLGVSYATVRRLLIGHKISFQRVSQRRTVIRESALLKYLEKATDVAAEPGESSSHKEIRFDRCVAGCERRRSC